MSESKARFSKPMAFFWLFRLNRTAMVAMITSAAAFTAGAGLARSLWMALVGWCLAVGGFSLDFYADRDLDIQGPRAEMRHNPLADGSLAPRTGLAFSLAFIAIGLVCVWLLVTRPSPRLAYVLTMVFMMGEGFLICAAMILGSM